MMRHCKLFNVVLGFFNNTFGISLGAALANDILYGDSVLDPLSEDFELGFAGVVNGSILATDLSSRCEIALEPIAIGCKTVFDNFEYRTVLYCRCINLRAQDNKLRGRPVPVLYWMSLTFRNV